MAYKRISPQPVIEGGTGAQAFTLDGVLIGNATSAINVTAAGTTGQILTGVTGSQPTFQAPAASSITITGDTGGGLTSNAFTFTGDTTGLTFAGAGTTETLGGTLVVAHGGTGITSATAYAPIVAGTTSTGAFQVASTGQSNTGYILTSTGASSVPTWQANTGAGSGLIFIQYNTVSSTTNTTFTSNISTTYDNYYIEVTAVYNSATANFLLQFSTNGGSTWITSGYTASAVGGIPLWLNSGTVGVNYLYANVFLNNITAAGNRPNGNVMYSVSVANTSGMYAGWYPTGGSMNAIRIITSDGSNWSGSASLYAYVK